MEIAEHGWAICFMALRFKQASQIFNTAC